MSTIINALNEAQQARKNTKEVFSEDASLPFEKQVRDHLMRMSTIRKAVPAVIFGIVVAALLSGGVFGLYKFFVRVKAPSPQVLHKEKQTDAFLSEKQPEKEDIKRLHQLGMTYANEGKINQAISCFEKVVNREESSPIAHNNLGVVYMDKGEIDMAVKEFLRAIEIAPNYAEAHFNIAIAYEIEEKFFEALGHYQKFIDLAPAEHLVLKKRVLDHIGS